MKEISDKDWESTKRAVVWGATLDLAQEALIEAGVDL